MRLAILDDYQNVSLKSVDWSPIRDHCEITVFNQHLGEEEKVAKQLQGFSIICCMRERTPFPASLLKQLPQLKLLVTTGAKNASIDLDEARSLGITVCGTESPGHAASELAWALIMALAKNIHIENKKIRQGVWQSSVGTDLKGQTLGIVGLGRHGKNVARYAQAFGMKCIAWSQNLTEDLCRQYGVEYVDKETLFRHADILTIHLKMGQRNRDLVTDREFNWMKPSAILVNTSRGSIINENALIKAAVSEKIAGIGLDVFDLEPLPKNHLLLSCDNVLLTPHIGFVTRQTYAIFYQQTVDAVLSWLKGQPTFVLN